MPKGIDIITMIFFGFVFIIGFLYTIFPKKMWEVFESWKATREPNNMFFVLRRVVGIIIMIIVIAIFLFPYLMSKLTT